MENKIQNNDDASSLYIHIPFCERKCFYCSFVVTIGQEHRINSYLQCLKEEAKRAGRMKVKTVFIGGGTPSFLNEEQMEFLFQIIHGSFDIEPNSEVTLEVNPESMDISKATLLKKLGVNRISLGAQSMSDERLKYLGRMHRAEGTKKAYDILRKAGFDNISLDLMFCFPDQTQSELKADLENITALQSEHLSLYTLTVEENSRFYAKKLLLSGEDTQADYYQMVADYLNQKGYQQYEVSNFSQPDRESLHNIHYWQGGNYLGLGVGAHSHEDGKRWWNKSKFMEYLQAIQKQESPCEGYEDLSSDKRLSEALCFGLRMNRGVDLAELKKRYQTDFSSSIISQIDIFCEEGLMIYKDARLCVTDRGRCVLDEISTRLI